MENIHILKFFADYIQAELGIIYVEANYFQLEHRLKDIAVQLGFTDLKALYHAASLGINGQMKSLLLDLATNNETRRCRLIVRVLLRLHWYYSQQAHEMVT